MMYVILIAMGGVLSGLTWILGFRSGFSAGYVAGMYDAEQTGIPVTGF